MVYYAKGSSQQEIRTGIQHGARLSVKKARKSLLLSGEAAAAGRSKKVPKVVKEDSLAEVQRLRAENEYLQALVLEVERRQRGTPG